MTDTLIRMEHVSKFYNSVIGLGDANIELPQGAYGLIGPNGSGKTTFINLITGMLAPSLGSTRVFDLNPLKQRQVLRRIGLCPASDILFPNVSGLRWVEYLTALHGYSRQEARQRAIHSLTRLGMEDRMHLPIGSYSLGMRQRVKLAQAVAHDPDLLILDEPFNGLDPIGRHELSDFLRQWIADQKSLILASHILHEVEAVTSAFLLIHGGRILASGDAQEVRSMLSGFPLDVQLHGGGLDLVAKYLIDFPWLVGMHFSEDRRRLAIKVSEREPFFASLVEVAVRSGVRIESVDSPDGTLETAFELLLKVHRGERLHSS